MTVSSALPLPASAILSTGGRFSMLTSSQLHRLHYHATNPGAYVRSRRHLARLTKLGLLRRFWGVYMDAPEYVYLPPSSKARTADMHTLDINELYVRLSESRNNGFLDDSPSHAREGLIFDPEPWCHVNVGHMVLKPDAYVDLGRMRFFIEMDRGTEFRSALAQKMRRYIAAFERWDEPTFRCLSLDNKLYRRIMPYIT
jgi:hypothetical protein